jgi:two-component system response regulator AtoC
LPTLEEAERQLIERALVLTRGHKGRACQMLGISRPTLERKLNKYGVARSVKGSLKSVS